MQTKISLKSGWLISVIALFLSTGNMAKAQQNNTYFNSAQREAVISDTLEINQVLGEITKAFADCPEKNWQQRNLIEQYFSWIDAYLDCLEKNFSTSKIASSSIKKEREQFNFLIEKFKEK